MTEKEFFRMILDRSKISGGLKFDPSEFSRKATAKKSDLKSLNAVTEAMKKSLNSGMLSFGEASSIAAQLQQSLQLLDVEIEIIEASVTEIVDNEVLKDIAEISYSDDGGGLYEPGVRVFKIKKKK